MGVINGQSVSAEVTNPAFLDATEDDTAIGKLSLANTDPASGSTVTNIQKEHNSTASFTGKALNAAANALPAWVSNDAGTSGDTLKARGDALSAKFNASTGHAHSGSAGDGALISAANLANVPLRGYVQQGTDIVGVTGSSSNVSSQFSAKTAGGSNLVKGVVTTAPWNKVLVRQASGANTDDVYKDANGNIVYGRLTESSGTWTLSYFVEVSATETAYSFGSASDVRFYYQEIYNPMQAAPTYSEFAIVPSDNTTADILDATTTVKGKVSLATASQSVGATNQAGTTNGSVANADHVHRGISSVIVGASTFYSDLTVTSSGGVTLTPGAGTVDISAPALTSSAPADIGSAASVGVATTSAKADHVHRGVFSVAKSGSSAIYGAVTLSATGGVTLTQASQDIQIDAPALAATAPNDVTNANQIGVGTTAARSDHTHKGARSLASSGGTQLFGDVIIAGTNGATVTQASQTISVDAPALSSSSPADIASAAAIGVGTTVARADHTHKGARSVASSGNPQLFGDIVIQAGSNVTLSQVGNTITIAAASGGGGGGGTVWYAPNANAPIQSEENNQNVYLFPQGGDARLVIYLRIPSGYVAGVQAFALISQYSPSAANTQLLQTTTYLIRAGVDAVSSTANSYTSTNTALTNTVSNMLRTSSLDLMSAAGQINGLNPAAGDILRIELYRGTDTDTADVRLIPSATQIKLT